MLSQEQANLVTVYKHLIRMEERGWDGLDDYLEYLSYLDDTQLKIECEVIAMVHSQGTVRCAKTHEEEECFIPLLVGAAKEILHADYNKEKGITDASRYILEYYLAMNQAGIIILDKN